MANLGHFFYEKGGVPQCLKHLAYFSKRIASWTVLVGFESPRVIFCTVFRKFEVEITLYLIAENFSHSNSSFPITLKLMNLKL